MGSDHELLAAESLHTFVKYEIVIRICKPPAVRISIGSKRRRGGSVVILNDECDRAGEPVVNGLVQAIAAFVRDVTWAAESGLTQQGLYQHACQSLPACLGIAAAETPPRSEEMVTAVLHRLIYREAWRIWDEGDRLERGGENGAALQKRRMSVLLAGLGDQLRGPLSVNRPARAAVATGPAPRIARSMTRRISPGRTPGASAAGIIVPALAAE